MKLVIEVGSDVTNVLVEGTVRPTVYQCYFSFGHVHVYTL